MEKIDDMCEDLSEFNNLSLSGYQRKKRKIFQAQIRMKAEGLTSMLLGS